MMWRALFIAVLLVMVGASAHAVPVAVQAAGAGPAAVAADPVAPAAAAGHARKKMVRRCARRSRLGICERWNMPKSALPSAKPDPAVDARNMSAKH
ncbi:MAG: hypothetical protein JF567_08835 [Xanthomonadales bacterium]|nr:hypothetical protein [Xanthomonadales bacterium]